MDKKREIRKFAILEKQRQFYKSTRKDAKEITHNIKTKNIEDLSYEELDNLLFHYSLKRDKNSIDRNGLKTQVGRNSQNIDKKPAIYFSKGIEGALETWDSWLKWRLNRLNSPYWQEENKEIQDKINKGIATEDEKKEYYWKEKLWTEEFTSGKYKEDKEKLDFLYEFQLDEMLESNYYLLDVKEGEEFTYDEIDVKKHANLQLQGTKKDMQYQMFRQMYGEYSDYETPIVDKWNMNTVLGKEITIEPSRISQIITTDGKTDVYSIVKCMYEKYKENVPESEQVKFDLLDGYMEYTKSKFAEKEEKPIKKDKMKQDLLIDSAVEAIEEKTRVESVNQQTTQLKNIQRQKQQEHNLQNNNNFIRE